MKLVNLRQNYCPFTYTPRTKKCLHNYRKKIKLLQETIKNRLKKRETKTKTDQGQWIKFACKTTITFQCSPHEETILP